MDLDSRMPLLPSLLLLLNTAAYHSCSWSTDSLNKSQSNLSVYGERLCNTLCSDNDAGSVVRGGQSDVVVVSGCDWLGPICRRLAQSGSLVFTSRLVGKGYTTINLVPTPQVKRVSSSQQLPVEFAEDCCSALQMCSLGCFSKDLSILSLVTGTPKGGS